MLCQLPVAYFLRNDSFFGFPAYSILPGLSTSLKSNHRRGDDRNLHWRGGDRRMEECWLVLTYRMREGG